MRFTKVPLIATLAAGALSLLVVLPALAQNDTRGRVGDGDFTVRVLKIDEANPADDAPAPTFFGGALYVSNDGDTNDDPPVNDVNVANLVRVVVDNVPTDSLTDPDGDDTSDCVEITVSNTRSGRKITVYAMNGAATPALFKVIPYGNPDVSANKAAGCDLASDRETNPVDPAAPDSDDPRLAIAARDGDVIRVTAKGAVRDAQLVVDGKGPEFSNIAPAHKSYSSSTSTRFQFTVADSGSGLRHDGEFVFTQGDQDAENVDADGDRRLGREPLSMAGGASADIDLTLNATNEIARGTGRWRQVGDAVGRSYSLDVSLPLTAGAENSWFLSARDRVGNQTRSDADSSKDDDQDYTITVDTVKPEFGEARTGVSYNPSTKKEVVNRSAVAVTLRNGQAGTDDDLSAVDHEDFRVEGYTVTGVIHANVKPDCDNADAKKQLPKDREGTCITKPKARIYLQLADELAPNETPEIEMLGGAVVDLAGNANDPARIEARDFIAPGLTVTVSSGSDASGRPVIQKSGEITVTVVSDEELRRRPAVYFASIINDGTKALADVNIREVAPGGSIAAQTADNTWRRAYRANATGLSGKDGLVAVIVTGDDAAGNIGSTGGWSPGTQSAPRTGDNLGLDDLIAGGLVVEVDDDLAQPTIELSPYRSADEKTRTESSRPYLTIEFPEANEAAYDVGGREAATGDPTTPATPTVRLSGDDIPVTDVVLEEDGDKVKLDSHSAVAITSATLDGDDVKTDLVAINSRKYTLATSGLSVGSHTLRITGRDDAGNTRTRNWTFEVAARSDYQLQLTPGWNLVSLPGTPTDSAIGDVIDSDLQAGIVLAYQNGEWATAVRVEGGDWQGTLERIEGGYGYWISTTAFETIATQIPETDTASVPSTANVASGWNLLGVVDVDQGKVGSAPNGGSDPDNYFSNLRWSVAYSYNTRGNDWTRILPQPKVATETIRNGKGYWVWATAPGTLVP